ncbi:MAG: SAM-dependent chlorinase/fluorinase, partial [Dehalococcoidia bacterium]
VQAAFLTQAAWPSFSSDSVHIAVVDPGVGTERRAIALETPNGRFVGPDNGVLSAALPDDARPAREGPVALPAEYGAVELTSRAYQRAAVSATFHGRDVFAPAAAHLSLGVALAALGPPVERIIALPPVRARPRADGAIEATVVHIDRFGNAVTDARAGDLPAGPLTIDVAGQRVPGLVQTYAEAAGPAALVSSSGFVEIALRDDNAAEALGIDIGARVVVRADGASR